MEKIVNSDSIEVYGWMLIQPLFSQFPSNNPQLLQLPSQHPLCLKYLYVGVVSQIVFKLILQEMVENSKFA